MFWLSTNQVMACLQLAQVAGLTTRQATNSRTAAISSMQILLWCSTCVMTLCQLTTCVLSQIAWQNGLMDLAMPFMIQFMKDYVGKVDTLMADRKDNMEARKVRSKSQLSGCCWQPCLCYIRL